MTSSVLASLLRAESRERRKETDESVGRLACPIAPSDGRRTGVNALLTLQQPASRGFRWATATERLSRRVGFSPRESYSARSGGHERGTRAERWVYAPPSTPGARLVPRTEARSEPGMPGAPAATPRHRRERGSSGSDHSP